MDSPPHSPGPDDVARAVIEAVARATDADPLDLPPLSRTLDADALDAFVANSRFDSLSFAWAGVRVTVFEDGTVRVRESTPE